MIKPGSGPAPEAIESAIESGTEINATVRADCQLAIISAVTVVLFGSENIKNNLITLQYKKVKRSKPRGEWVFTTRLPFFTGRLYAAACWELTVP